MKEKKLKISINNCLITTFNTRTSSYITMGIETAVIRYCLQIRSNTELKEISDIFLGGGYDDRARYPTFENRKEKFYSDLIDNGLFVDNMSLQQKQVISKLVNTLE